MTSPITLAGDVDLTKDAATGDLYRGQPFPLGALVQAWDPFIGPMELVFAQFTTASTLVNVGRLVHLDENFTLLDMPNTANTGRSLYVVAQRFPSTAGISATNPLFGFVARAAGRFPVQASAAFTAGAMYFAAAGQTTHVLTAGKQILNARGLISSAGTLTKSAYTQTGSPMLSVGNKDGLYPGVAVSGTGIPGGTTITTLDTGLNNTVQLSANATGTAAITATFTHTGYTIAQFDRPFVQGNIT
jgi:hypothetical protein